MLKISLLVSITHISNSSTVDLVSNILWLLKVETFKVYTTWGGYPSLIAIWASACKVENIVKGGSLDSIPSPSQRVKIQIAGESLLEV